MNIRDCIIFIITLLIIGCDGSYQSNDDEMVTELKSNDKKFVSVGDLGTILTSSDGISWTSRTSGTTQSLYDVSYGGSTFVAVGYSGTILTSSDGTTWTSRTSGTSQALWGVSYGKGHQY